MIVFSVFNDESVHSYNMCMTRWIHVFNEVNLMRFM